MSTPWPSTLPQKPDPSEYNEEEPDNTITSEPDAGPPITRPRTSAKGPSLDLVFYMTKTQLATFKTFYRTTLSYGSIAYEWTHPETGETSDFVFLKPPPKYSFIGGEHESTELWKVSFKVYQKP
jgi:hypothetical protein